MILDGSDTIPGHVLVQRTQLRSRKRQASWVGQA